MNSMMKRYVPYAVVILLAYMIVPLLFLVPALAGFSAIAYYFVFPAIAIVCSAVFCSKYGLDFFFTLIAPVVFIPSMLIYNGGFQITNIILLVAYLVAGIFGLYIGDIAFGDKRRQAEAEADKKAEAKLLNAKRRGETLATEPEVDDDSFEDDDFDIDTYTSNRTGRYATESEIDDILSEFGSSSK